MDFGIYLLSGGNSSFVFHPLLKNDRALPMTLVGIGRRRLIICPTNASYRLSEPYREVFVTDKKILEYYNRFYDSVLWKEWIESQEETSGTPEMKELIETPAASGIARSGVLPGQAGKSGATCYNFCAYTFVHIKERI